MTRKYRKSARSRKIAGEPEVTPGKSASRPKKSAPLSISGQQASPLRQRMLEDMRLTGLAPKTQEHYISTVVSLPKHVGGTSPDRIPEKQVRAYLLQLRDDHNCARGTFHA